MKKKESQLAAKKQANIRSQVSINIIRELSNKYRERWAHALDNIRDCLQAFNLKFDCLKTLDEITNFVKNTSEFILLHKRSVQ